MAKWAANKCNKRTKNNQGMPDLRDLRKGRNIPFTFSTPYIHLCISAIASLLTVGFLFPSLKALNHLSIPKNCFDLWSFYFPFSDFFAFLYFLYRLTPCFFLCFPEDIICDADVEIRNSLIRDQPVMVQEQ